ncbi:caspase family protein [Embleya sp. NPDC059237]|uniref:caspase family protein n=1 Tax=Embleya sp. NPDC059237 TaxID=3346784 RepID=UPI003689F245
MSDGTGKPGRFLIATAIARYPKAPAHLRWDRPGLSAARERVVELFTDRLGYRHVSALGMDPTQDQLTGAIRSFCRAPERRADDLIAVYIGGHGAILDEEDGGGHVLCMHDTDPDDLPDALQTSALARKILAGTPVRRLLLMLDTCYSGRGGHELAAAALEKMNPRWAVTPGAGVALLTSAQPNEEAATGAFPLLLERAVESWPVAGHGPQALPLDAIVRHMNDDSRRPGHQRVGLTLLGLDGEPPPFLASPRHDPTLNDLDLATASRCRTEREAQTRRRETEYLDYFLPRAQAHHGAIEHTEWWYRGRHQALADIAEWLDHVDFRLPAMAVTADPGSGKTAVLGLIATLNHPRRRSTIPVHTLGLGDEHIPAPGVIDAAVYARNLTDDQVLDAIAAAAGVPAAPVDELIKALRTHTRNGARPITVLIDALDEASTPHTLCALILRPLIDDAGEHIRFLLGTRPHLLHHLGLRRDDQVDLDCERHADPDALLAYTMRNLLKGHPASPYPADEARHRLAVARCVAEAAGRSFLVARITATTLAATAVLPDPNDHAWRAELPHAAGDAMRADLTQRLGPSAPRAVDLLRPLAFAQGRGLPWEDLWANLATAISGRSYDDNDLLWLREHAGSYIVETVDNGRSVYRLYHQALIEHLRQGVEHIAVHAMFTRTLADRVPRTLEDVPDWARAHPYTRAQLAAHAAAANLLDPLLDDTEYLVHAQPRTLIPHLHNTRTLPARLAAAIYRDALTARRDADTETRRQALQLAACQHRAQSVVDALDAHTPPSTWRPTTATGGSLSPAHRDTLLGHAGSVASVACAVVDGRPVAVTGSDDNTVRIWELATGNLVGELTGHTRPVRAVACAVVDGRPVAVTGSDDNTMRIWDLVTGRPFGEPLTGHTDWVTSVACTVMDGVSVAVTGSDDHTVRVWNLATGSLVGELTGHTRPVSAVACAVVDGRPVAVTGSDDHTVRLWDLATGSALGEAFTGHTAAVSAVACTVMDGVPIAVTGSDDHSVRVWDLATRSPLGEPFTGHTAAVSAVACTAIDGVPVAVTGSDDHAVRMWDLGTASPVGGPLTGYTTSTVLSVACTIVDGVPVAVTGFDDRTVRIWNLATRSPLGEPFTGHSDWVTSVAGATVDDRPVAVTGSDDSTVRIWDLATGGPVGEPLTGHTDCVTSVACAVMDDRPVAVTGAQDNTVRVWDLATGSPLGVPLTGHTDSVTSVACAVVDGSPVAVTGSLDRTVRMWSLATGRAVGKPLTGHSSPVGAVACAVVDGRPVAVTGSNDNTVRVWDLPTGSPIGQPLIGHTDWVTSVACVTVSGMPLAITGSSDRTVRVWDLVTGVSLGEPLTEHSDMVLALACLVVDGIPVVVTGSSDGTVRVRGLPTGKFSGEPQARYIAEVGSAVHTVLDGNPVAVAGFADRIARARHLRDHSNTERLVMPSVCLAVAFGADHQLITVFGNDIAVWRRTPSRPGPNQLHSAGTPQRAGCVYLGPDR